MSDETYEQDNVVDFPVPPSDEVAEWADREQTPEEGEVDNPITVTYFEARPYIALDAYLDAGVLNLILSLSEAELIYDGLGAAIADARN